MIRTALFVAVLVPATFIASLVMAVGGAAGAPDSFHDWIQRRWAGAMLAAAGVRLRVEGVDRLEPGEPAILACNHQSALDIWALMAALPVSVRFVAKEELARIPIFAQGCRAAGHVFVDRGSPGSALEAMDRAGREMRRRGITLAIFPEGTRSSDGRLRGFKRGSFRLAKRTGAPIYPVALEGGARILPKGRRRIRPGELEIHVGEPLPAERVQEMGRREVARRVHDRVEGMLEEMRAGVR